ncbi:MAG: ABC transporter permease [Acidobacteriota bacterium]
MHTRARLLWEAASLAVQSILSHKLRAFLTLLGIIIGVASVMVVGASIEGLESYVQSTVTEVLGSNSFILSRFPHFGDYSEEEWRKMVRRNRDLYLDDLHFLRERCRDCQDIGAEISGNHTIHYQAEEIFGTSVSGATANIVYLGNLTIEDGRFFSEQEVERSRFICVIGWDLKEKFFPTTSALDRYLKVADQPFKIIGILTKRGSAFGHRLDNTLYVPIKAYQKTFGSRRSITIRGRSASREDFQAALDQVRVAMRSRHHLRPGEEDDFGLMSTEEINSKVDEFTGKIAMVVIPITLISLVIGGIVVMNIMLVTVTERTFEIGIRKAIGARRSDILYQFLMEAVLLSILGGSIGLGLAAGISWAVESLTSLPMTVSIGYIMLAIGVSGSIGIIFGIYPALKASKLDPIVALGTER